MSDVEELDTSAGYILDPELMEAEKLAWDTKKQFGYPPSYHSDLGVVEEIPSSTVFGLPKAIFFIIGMEFCERFSYFGMSAILPPYLTEVYGFSEDTATEIIHGFVFAAYFVSLLGGVLSDSYLGKFKTILLFSMVYCLGNLTLSVSAIPSIAGVPPTILGLVFGLVFIALGTGGIKPCVSSFGADHFGNPSLPSVAAKMTLYFSMFYFAINAGSLISMIVTPILRTEVICFGSACYSLAFGVPAILMAMALCVFLLGYRCYIHAGFIENIPLKMLKVIFYCLRQHHKKDPMDFESASSSSIQTTDSTEPLVSKGRFLDRALGYVPASFIEDMRKVLKVLMVLFPTMFYWALYSQQSSRWVYQGYQMDNTISVGSSSYHMPAEQMQIVNTVLILVLIPIFDRLIYPFCRRLKARRLGVSPESVKLDPLTRMIIGMFLCSLTFVEVAILQLFIDNSASRISLLVQIPQYFLLTVSEILFSITSMEFAYSEAPASMKSVCSAFSLLSVAFGNLFVMIITAINPFGSSYTADVVKSHEMVWNFGLYAGLNTLAAFWLVYLARQYKQKS